MFKALHNAKTAGYHILDSVDQLAKVKKSLKYPYKYLGGHILNYRQRILTVPILGTFAYKTKNVKRRFCCCSVPSQN